MRFFLSIFLLTISQLNCFATKIIRGPYLQKLTTNSIIVRYRTNEATKTYIKYGKDKKNLDHRQDNYLFTNDHTIDLSKLEPNTRYFYEIYDESKKEPKRISQNLRHNHSFKTAPEAEQKAISYIWVLGDPGVSSEKEFSRRIREEQNEVKEGFLNYLKKNQIKKANLMLTLGDNVYSFGTDEEFQKGFFDAYKENLINTPIYTAFGNHDAGIRKDFIAFSARSYPKPRGTYYEIFSLPGKKAYYSFDYGMVHFVVLDSFDSIWEENLGEIEGNEKVWTHNSKKSNPMLNWFESDLKASKARWKIVVFHHPPYADEDDNAEKKELWKAWMNAYAVPIIEKYKVDLVLSGHVHNYQRTYPFQSILLKEKETQITSKEKSEIDETVKYSYFYNRGESLVDLKLPIYEPKIISENKSDYIQGEGTIYTVVGSSGSAFKRLRKKDSPFFANKAQKAGSILLTIEKEKLGIKFITKDAEVLDEFNIKHIKS